MGICKDISARLMPAAAVFSDVMLPDTDERVKSFFESRRKFEKPEDDILRSLMHGESWPKCFEKHKEARKHLEQVLEKKAGQL